MVYLWWEVKDYPHGCIGMYDWERDEESLDLRGILQTARRIPSPQPVVPTVKFGCSANRLAPWDNLDTDTGVPLVGPRLRGLLEEVCPGDIQMIDAELVARWRKRVDGYQFVHITHTVLAIDHENSECRMMSDGTTIRTFRKLRYHPDCMEEHDLARDAEYRSHIVVSRRLRDAIIQGGFRGVGMRTTDGPYP